MHKILFKIKVISIKFKKLQVKIKIININVLPQMPKVI